MDTNPDDWWLRRRHPSVSPGDAWSGNGKAYRAWMGAKPRRGTPGPPGAVQRRGRSLALGAAGLAAIAFLAPLAWAGHWHSCAAAEVALADDAVGQGSRFGASKRRVANWTGPDGRLVSHGRVGRQIAAEEHAGWPSPFGCTALFWRVRSEGASFGGFTAVLSRAPLARR